MESAGQLRFQDVKRRDQTIAAQPRQIAVQRAHEIVVRIIPDKHFRAIVLDKKLLRPGVGEMRMREIAQGYVGKLDMSGKEGAIVALLKIDIDKVDKKLLRAIAQTPDKQVKVLLTRIQGKLKKLYALTRLAAAYDLRDTKPGKAMKAMMEMSQRVERGYWSRTMSRHLGEKMAAVRKMTAMKRKRRTASVVRRVIGNDVISDMLGAVAVKADAGNRRGAPLYAAANVVAKLKVQGARALESFIKLGFKKGKGDVARSEVDRVGEWLQGEIGSVEARIKKAIESKKDKPLANDMHLRDALRTRLHLLKRTYQLARRYAVRVLGDMALAGNARAQAAFPVLMKMMTQEPLLKRAVEHIVALDNAGTPAARQLVEHDYRKLCKAKPDYEDAMLERPEVSMVGGLVQDVSEGKHDQWMVNLDQKVRQGKVLRLKMGKKMLRELVIAIGKIRNRKAIPFLRAMYREGRMVPYAIIGLGRTGDRRVAQFLRKVVIDGRNDQESQIALGALCNFLDVLRKPDAKLRKGMLKLLKSDDFMVERAAAIALGVSGDVRAVPTLLAMLRSKVSTRGSGLADYSLGREKEPARLIFSGGTGESMQRVVIALMANINHTMLGMKGGKIARKVIVGLIKEAGIYKHAQSVLFLKSVIENKRMYAAARLLAITTLARHPKSEKTIAYLQMVAFNATNPYVKSVALGALMRFPEMREKASPAFVGKVAKLLNSSNPVLRRTAALVLGALGDKHAVPMLLKMIAAKRKMPLSLLHKLDPAMRKEGEPTRHIYGLTKDSNKLVCKLLSRMDRKSIDWGLKQLAGRISGTQLAAAKKTYRSIMNKPLVTS